MTSVETPASANFTISTTPWESAAVDALFVVVLIALPASAATELVVEFPSWPAAGLVDRNTNARRITVAKAGFRL
jgi:hypothetical protein